MHVEQNTWTLEGGWSTMPSKAPWQPRGEVLALVFGSKRALLDAGLLSEVRRRYAGARILGCSTAGEICDTRVRDESLVVTAVSFEHTAFRGARVLLEGPDGFRAGTRLAAELPKDGLSHVFVLSDGKHVNGTTLVAGISSSLPDGVLVTGGLAGDGERFGETLVVWDEPASGVVAAVGFYGDRLRIGCGSLGGWDPFGPERLITRSEGNVLHELDGQSALALYKRYLGEQAAGLPATAVLFPLGLRTGGEQSVVRTVLSVDEEAQTMTFAGDIPQGTYARLMKANFDRLVDGAMGAARSSRLRLAGSSPDLAVLISCVGRKMVLRQRVEEEVEGVREVLGPGTVLTGFYSYGEISPFTSGGRCELHNQTMTITSLSEH
jgi:hypothetical protein